MPAPHVVLPRQVSHMGLFRLYQQTSAHCVFKDCCCWQAFTIIYGSISLSDFTATFVPLAEMFRSQLGRPCVYHCLVILMESLGPVPARSKCRKETCLDRHNHVCKEAGDQNLPFPRPVISPHSSTFPFLFRYCCSLVSPILFHTLVFLPSICSRSFEKCYLALLCAGQLNG